MDFIIAADRHLFPELKAKDILPLICFFFQFTGFK